MQLASKRAMTTSFMTIHHQHQMINRLVAASSFHTCSMQQIFSKSYSKSNSTPEEVASNKDKPENKEESAEEESQVISKEEYDKLASELEDAKSKTNDFLDKYRRSIAENDNMRKRLTKQIEDAKIFGIQGFCKDLLDVADVLAKAVEAGKAIEGQQQGNKDMVEGLKLTQTQLLQVFGRHGLTQIDPVKGEEKFDPNLHEALFQIPAPNLDPNIVMDVQKIGYSLHGRTIRPALVGVSKKWIYIQNFQFFFSQKAFGLYLSLLRSCFLPIAHILMQICSRLNERDCRIRIVQTQEQEF